MSTKSCSPNISFLSGWLAWHNPGRISKIPCTNLQSVWVCLWSFSFKKRESNRLCVWSGEYCCGEAWCDENGWMRCGECLLLFRSVAMRCCERRRMVWGWDLWCGWSFHVFFSRGISTFHNCSANLYCSWLFSGHVYFPGLHCNNAISTFHDSTRNPYSSPRLSTNIYIFFRENSAFLSFPLPPISSCFLWHQQLLLRHWDSNLFVSSFWCVCCLSPLSWSWSWLTSLWRWLTLYPQPPSSHHYLLRLVLLLSRFWPCYSSCCRSAFAIIWVWVGWLEPVTPKTFQEAWLWQQSSLCFHSFH